MKISREQAQHLVDTYCYYDEPLPDAVERAVAHEWTQRDRESIHDVEVGRTYADQDEVDRVLYGEGS